MIRYTGQTRAELEALIDAYDPRFRAKAVTETALLVREGKFDGTRTPFWSDVKPVFMKIQKNKCIFCERVLGAQLTGKAEHDVEHYRPKGRVKAWPYPKCKPKVSYDFDVGSKSDTGYYWLAYDVENYACACKGCNSDRKSDYFPIRGVRGAAIDDIGSLNVSEKPLILFPQGEQGDDPEHYITFEGVLAIPVPQAGEEWRRAKVTIDFFSLNDREELLADRARVIRELYKTIELERTTQNPDVRANASRDVQTILSDASPQAACAKAYLKLMTVDYAKAWAIYEDIERYLSR